jgi:hypothetical protein
MRKRIVVGALLVAATLGSVAFAGVQRWRLARSVSQTVAPTPSLGGGSPPSAAVAPTVRPEVSDDNADAGSLTPIGPSSPAVNGQTTATVPRAKTSVPNVDWLREANLRRAAHQWREAEQLYERVVASEPGSDDAYAAMVAAASLQANHLGAPREALRLFAAADRLRPRGPLAEEVAYGRILAYRALGQADDEKRALEAFVTTYAQSPWQDAARKRLRELGE